MGDKIRELLSQAAAATLVRYDNPLMVTTHSKRQPKFVINFDNKKEESKDTEDSNAVPEFVCPPDGSLNKRETEEILNAILPPKEWFDESGNLWRQTVSSIPATRSDVIALEEQLNTRLRQRQARESGICEIRRELYTQCFDELIRQVTINCAERGLLLLRDRDEIRMTLDAFGSLYESSSAFSMRKILMSESKKSDLEKKTADVLSGKGALEEIIAQLDVQLEEVDQKYIVQREQDQLAHVEEIAALKLANQTVKKELEGLLFPRKAAG